MSENTQPTAPDETTSPVPTEPAAEAVAETAVTPVVPTRSWKHVLKTYAGWLVWSALFIGTIIGLCIVLLSQSQQIDGSSPSTQTVPRKVVTVPTQSSLWPEQNRSVDVSHTIEAAYSTAVEAQKKTLESEPVTAKPVETAPIVVASVQKPVITKPVEKPFHDHHIADFKNPVIAIVIDDVGLDRRHSLQMMDMAAPITLAFMPYAQRVNDMAQQAREKGHELIVHMPMEPEDLAHNNPGPDALLLKNGEAENVRRFDKNLNAFTGYMGINNHMGSAFTASRADITPILKDLKQRGLWFLDSKTNPRSVAASVANDIGLPFASRDIFLDNVNSKAAVLAQLKQTEAVARQKGYAIAIGHPKEGTVAGLQAWIADVQSRGFTLVPLSSIIQARFPQASLPRYARAADVKLARHQDAPAEEPTSN